MKISLGSSPVGSDTSNASPKSQNTRTQMPYASQLINWWKKMHSWLMHKRVTLPHFMCKTQFCCSVVSYKHSQDCKLTLMGVCCVWQNLLTLFCKLKVASVRITHCSRKHNNQTLNINRGPHQRVINALHRFYFYGNYFALKTTVAEHNGLHLFLKTNSDDLLSFNNQQTFSSL